MPVEDILKELMAPYIYLGARISISGPVYLSRSMYSSHNNFCVIGWSTGPIGTDLRREKARQKYI
jgi:hypothetical protein